MRKLLLALLMLMPTVVEAADVTLAWDARVGGEAWQNVRAYEKVGTTYTRVGEVAGAVTTLTIPNVVPGVHTYIVRSFATPWGESVDSNAVSTPGPAVAPSGLKVTVVVTVTIP